MIMSCRDTGQVRVAGSSNPGGDTGYTYDPAWNLSYRTNAGSVNPFIVDGKNELTNAFNATYTYDANGNLVSGTNGHTAYVYDDENRLVQWFWFAQDAANYTNGALRSDFLYDGVGRLRIRVEFAIPVQAPTNPPQGPTIGLETPQDPWQFVSETHYIYDGLRVIQERDSTNTPTVSYTRGNDLSGSLEGAGGIAGLLARSAGYSGGNWTSHTYYHADGNGNITCLIEASQSAVARYRYDPFGNTVVKLGALADANVYRFSSKELHVASGMYYYLYRLYDPSLQRWVNRDPVAEPGFAVLRGRQQKEAHRGANQYRFSLNDPCGFIDPEGLTVWVCSRKTDWGAGNHVYFYDDDPEHGPSQSCSMQGSSGSGGTVNGGDVGPDQNPNCTPVEGTGEPGQDNDRARAIMSCCEQTINNGPYVPLANDCHNRLNTCLSAGGNHYPIRHPRFGKPTVTPIFSPMPLAPRTVTP